MRSIALSNTQQRRLEKLAVAAGRTPQAMLRFVLRDGFDICETEVRESVAAEKEAAVRGYIPHSDAQRAITAALAHAHKSRKAA